MTNYLLKRVLLLLICLICSLKLEAKTEIEFRVAAFIPIDQRFREIYGHVLTCYEVEATTSLSNCVELWANFDYFCKQGGIKGCGKSRLSILNVSLGPKYVYPLCKFGELYGGIGFSAARSSIKNHLYCMNREFKTAYGAVFKTGINLYLRCNVFLDVFFDYLYLPINYQRRTDIGGIKTGLGIGYQF